MFSLSAALHEIRQHRHLGHRQYNNACLDHCRPCPCNMRTIFWQHICVWCRKCAHTRRLSRLAGTADLSWCSATMLPLRHLLLAPGMLFMPVLFLDRTVLTARFLQFGSYCMQHQERVLANCITQCCCSNHDSLAILWHSSTTVDFSTEACINWHLLAAQSCLVGSFASYWQQCSLVLPKTQQLLYHVS